jgi:hypothetical protein
MQQQQQGAVMGRAGSLLGRLQVELLVLVFQLLPLRDQLLHASHLSSSFPRLSPACFQHDDPELK